MLLAEPLGVIKELLTLADKVDPGCCCWCDRGTSSPVERWLGCSASDSRADERRSETDRPTGLTLRRSVSPRRGVPLEAERDVDRDKSDFVWERERGDDALLVVRGRPVRDGMPVVPVVPVVPLVSSLSDCGCCWY